MKPTSKPSKADEAPRLDILKSLKPFPLYVQKIYPASFSTRDGLTYGLVRTKVGRQMVVMGEKSRVLSDPFKGECFHEASSLKVCNLTTENTQTLMTFFPFTKPVSLRKYPVTIGTGDRLGLATPGHIRAVRKFGVRPVLAQQSVRENGRTGRTFKDMIRDTAWAVFQENYKQGYGADGDHLKTLGEVKESVDAGVSMVTLDLSEKLDPEAFRLPESEINQRFEKEIDQEDAKVLFHFFLEKEFPFQIPHGGFAIQLKEESIKRNMLFFYKAIDFAEKVYEYIQFRRRRGSVLDFEIAIDEVGLPTAPENHLFFIIELKYRGIHIDALAPRFVGQFQKGIDYRGDLKELRRQLTQHVRISADYGEYKISVHSGSDKFSIYPDIGKIAGNGLHLKTAGTSWLEAMRLVALVNPSLFREMHQVALSNFNEAAKIYPVTADPARIPKIESLQDQQLPSLLDQNDSRQLLHITYGYLLDPQKNLRNRFLALLSQYEENYWSLLESHFEKHLTSLGLEQT